MHAFDRNFTLPDLGRAKSEMGEVTGLTFLPEDKLTFLCSGYRLKAHEIAVTSSGARSREPPKRILKFRNMKTTKKRNEV